MIRDKYIANIVSEISLIKGSFSGSTVGGTPEWTTSEKGRCLKMDGSTDYLDIGNTTKSVKSATFVVQPDSITSHTDYVIDLNGTDYISIVNGTVTVNGFAGATTNVFINGIDINTISDISKLQHITVVSDTTFLASDLDIARLEGTGFFGGKISYVILFDNELTAEDCAKSFEDWQRTIPYTAVDFKSVPASTGLADGYVQAYIADGKGWNESIGNVTSGFLENTGFTVNTGTWKVSDRDGFNKILECVADGQLEKPLGGVNGWTTNTFELVSGTPALTKNSTNIQIDAVAGDKVGIISLINE